MSTHPTPLFHLATLASPSPPGGSSPLRWLRVQRGADGCRAVVADGADAGGLGGGVAEEVAADGPEAARGVGPGAVEIEVRVDREVADPGACDEPLLEASAADDDDVARGGARHAVDGVLQRDVRA